MRTIVFKDRVLACIVSCTVALATCPIQDAQSAAAAQSEPPTPDHAQPSQLTPEQLQELVAPIALYPDALVAQILAASAYPTQIVEAERFLQQNPDLKGAALGAEVDKQDWDPSVKALTQFPSVLANMNRDLSWTSELGDANYNQQADVMNAIQFMREKAKDAGHLQSTPQQTVTTEGDNIDIQPANPDVVYVPEYDPEFVYGYPVGLWPGFYPWWGVTGPYLSFGVGFGIGPFFGFGWGWQGWGFDWYHRGLLYGGRPYGFHSHAFYDRNAYFHGNYRGFAREGGRGYGAPGRSFAPYARGDRGLRGYGGGGAGGRAFSPLMRPGTRSGAFSGITHGGYSRSFSARGRSSFGGGMRGGGMHAGGAHGGGRR
jgi:uncharacterized membrane protein YgcG